MLSCSQRKSPRSTRQDSHEQGKARHGKAWQGKEEGVEVGKVRRGKGGLIHSCSTTQDKESSNPLPRWPLPRVDHQSTWCLCKAVLH